MESETKSQNISAEQVRMARAALEWTVRDLAREADMAPNTVLSIEHGRPVSVATMHRLRDTLERAGVLFRGNGIRVSVEVVAKSGANLR